jgi:hypothetical protein
MKRIGWVFTALVLLMGSNADGASRIESKEMKGVFISYGPGIGNSKMSRDYWGREVKDDAHFASNVRAGFSFRPDLLFSLEGNAGYFEQDDVCWRYLSTALVLTFYPHNNFFLKAGPLFGEVDHRWEEKDGWQVSVVTWGVGFHAAVGGDIRLNNRYSLLPIVQYDYLPIDPGSYRQLSLLLEIGLFF